MKRRLLTLTLLLLAAPLTAHEVVPHEHAHAQSAFVETFDGAPSSPEPWRPTDWDIQIHDNERTHWKQFPPIAALHGPDCSAPPATHTVSSHEQAVFICNNHVMTALNGNLALLYLTPNRLVDFGGGEAVVRFDMSTLRTSSRDWVDLWVSPYEENLALPNDETGDLNGPPRRAVHLEMSGAGDTFFSGEIYREFTSTGLPQATYEGMERVLTPSAVNREPFELRISRTRIRFGLPNRNLWWIDTAVADLGWSRGVVQLGHRAYDAGKGCEVFDLATGRYVDVSPGTCPNTWHWDNVRIEPAVPITILRADRRYVDATTAPGVAFPAPAPQAAYLRFGAVGRAIQVSFNDGATWQAALAQAQQPVLGEDAFGSYWTPIPAGTTRVHFRGQNSGANWMARGISIFATGASAPPSPAATATATPAATPTATVTAVPPTMTPVPATPVPLTCEVRVRVAGIEAWLPKPAAFCEGT